ncbi:MAG: hypothetical protein AB7N76_13960 [Planctomycetota bacterium]
MRRTCLLLALFSLPSLAGCAAPPAGVRHDTLVRARAGCEGFELDPRAYVDRPLEVSLPRGPYASLSLYRAGEPERLVQLGEGDPRLGGDPVRVQLLFPSAEGKAPRAGEYRLVVTDARGRIHELGFAVLERPRVAEEEAE